MLRQRGKGILTETVFKPAGYVLFLLLLVLPAQAGNEWKSALIIPGAKVLASGHVAFKTCFTAKNSGRGWWYNCSHQGRGKQIGWHTVWKQVHRDVNFRLNESGYVYLVFTSRVSDTWRYDGCSAAIAENIRGKWQNIQLGFSLRSALYRGDRLVDTSPYASQPGPPPLKYRINPDGKIQFWNYLPHYRPGRYRLTVTAAMFHNMNTTDKTYFPSRAEYKLVFVPDKPVQGTAAGPSGQMQGQQLSANRPQNVWVVNRAGNVYRLGQNGKWAMIPGKKAKDIGVGANGTAWIVGTSPVYGGFAIYRWTGRQFERVDGGAVRIDVDPNGMAWVVNSMNDIYRFTGNHWVRMPGKATDIGIGANGAVFVLGIRHDRGGYEIYKWNGSGWDRFQGAGRRIDVDESGNPWVVNGGTIYRWKAKGWQVLPGRGTDVSVCNKTAWVIGTDFVSGGHGIYRWNDKTRKWKRMPGGAVEISVGGCTAGNAPGGTFIQTPPSGQHVQQARFKLKSGKYKVEIKVDGNMITSTWTLRVRKGHITGISSWPCCPGPRTDPMKGKVTGSGLVIKRDCSGQGWRGGCVQTYTGKVNGNRIEGTATGTGLSGHKTTWTLYIDSQNPIFDIRRIRKRH